MTDQQPSFAPGDDPAETALRRSLTRTGATRPLAPPPDMLGQALRRLPAAPPQQVAVQARSEQLRRAARRWSSFAALALVALTSGWAFWTNPRPALPAPQPSPGGLTAAFTLPLGSLAGAVAQAAYGGLVGLSALTLSALLLSRWPGRTANSGATLLRHPTRSLLLGLPIAVVLAALLSLAGVAATSPYGLPLAALLLLAAVAPQVYGLATLARLAGARIARRATPAPDMDRPTAAVMASLALLLAVCVALAPALTPLMLGVLAAPGLGAAALSAAGTRRPPPPNRGTL